MVNSSTGQRSNILKHISRVLAFVAWALVLFMPVIWIFCWHRHHSKTLQAIV